LEANEKQFIKNLSQSLKPMRTFNPFHRTIFWLLLFIPSTVLFMLYLQAYRPTFLDHLIHYPRFSLEIVSGCLLGSLFVFSFFGSIIPGYRFSKKIIMSGFVFLALLLISLFLSFIDPSPPESHLGARPYCAEEAFAYEILGVLSLIVFLRNIDWRISFTYCLFAGIGVGLFPALLMEMACMYTPMHALFFHFGPSVFVGIFAAYILSIKITR